MSDLPNTPSPADAQHATRSGDLGQTVLGETGEVTKGDVRVTAFGDCEEANAAIGVALAIGGLPADVIRTLTSAQNDLFDLASDLSAPGTASSDSSAVRIVDGHLDWLERAIEHYSAPLREVQGYVLPGGTVAAGLLFWARTVVRRAERSTWAVLHDHPDSGNPLTARYLNRLSGLLFVLARGGNAEHGDTQWHPLASVTAPPEAEPQGV